MFSGYSWIVTKELYRDGLRKIRHERLSLWIPFLAKGLDKSVEFVLYNNYI